MGIKNYSIYSTIGGMLSFSDIINSDFTKKTNKAFLTDFNTLHGVPAFIEECKKANVDPVIGVTLRIKEDDNYLGNITLYAKNKAGFDNLKKITSTLKKEKSKESYTTLNDIIKHKDDLIVTNGGFDSIIYNHLKNNKKDEASRFIYNFSQLFKDDFYLETQNNNLEITNRINNYLVNLSSKNNLQLLESKNARFKTEDSYYLFLEKHKNVLGVSNPLNLSLKNMFLTNDILETKEETDRFFNNSVLNDFFTKVSSYDITVKIPELPIVPGNENSKLVEEIRKAYPEFISKIDPSLHDKYQERIREELEIIKSLNFENYFLLFLDIEKNKVNGQKFNLRGSSVSFLILHILKLSDVDPLKNGLLTERFLNKNRLIRHELPDIDLESDNIDAVSEHLKSTYGNENVAYLSNSSSMNAIPQITLAANALERDIKENPLNKNGEERIYPKEAINKLRTFVKAVWGSDKKTLADLLKENAYVSKRSAKFHFKLKGDYTNKNDKEFHQEYWKINNITSLFNNDPDVKKFFGFALRTNDLITSYKVNYSSLVVSNKPLNTFFTTSNYNLKSDAVLDLSIDAGKDYIEKLGLVKLDILPNVYLNKLNNCYTSLGLKWEFEDLNNPYVDKNVFKMLSEGYTETINQLDAQSSTVKEVGADNFDELVNLLALIRPGVEQYKAEYIKNKNNPNQIKYENEEMREILQSSHGVIVFEEQMMLITQKIGGFTKEESDDFRSLMKKSKGSAKNSKELNEKINKMKEKFIQYASEKHSPEIAKNVLTLLNNVEGGYTFSKAHSLSYASLIYRQGLLDVNYPAEYLQHFIINTKKKQTKKKKNDTSDVEEKTTFDKYINKCVKMGRKFLTVDINRSIDTFKTRKKNDVIYIDPSLMYVLKDEKLTNIIMDERKNGKFENIYDFIERTMPKYNDAGLLSGFWLDDDNVKNQMSFSMNVKKLINAGAFDSLFPNDENGNKLNLQIGRTVLLYSVDNAISLASNPYSMEDFEYTIPNEALSLKDILNAEKDTLGYSPIEINQIQKKNMKNTQSSPEDKNKSIKKYKP